MKIYYFREGESNSNHPPSPHSGKPLFEMCGFYMGIAQIALDPRPLHSVNRANVDKKKVPETILTSLYTPPPLTGNAHLETTHFKKGLLCSFATIPKRLCIHSQRNIQPTSWHLISWLVHHQARPILWEAVKHKYLVCAFSSTFCWQFAIDSTLSF